MRQLRFMQPCPGLEIVSFRDAKVHAMEHRQQSALFHVLPDIDRDLHDSATDQSGNLGQFVLVGLDRCGKFTM